MLLSFMAEGVWPVFSSRSLIVSGLVSSRSLIRLEVIFACGVRRGSDSISARGCQSSRRRLLKGLSFLRACSCLGLSFWKPLT